MRRSESLEQLTAQAQEDRSYEAVSERSTPAVEFRGERRPVEPSDARRTSSEVAFDPDALLVHGCRQIINLFIPVSFCMLFVVIISRAVPFYSNDSSVSQSFTEGSITGQSAGDGVVIALVVIGFIIVATCIMVLCFKFRCMRFIKGYMFVVGFIVLFVLSSNFFLAFCSSFNIFIDFITIVLFIWNFGIIGLFSFFWKAPLLSQQVYSVFIGAQIALTINLILPWWTSWFLLGFLAIWDLIAVLCPMGPLRILVEQVQESEEPFPAILVYSTAAGIVFMADAPRSPSPPKLTTPESTRPAVAELEEDDGGFETHVENTERAERLLALQDDPEDFTASARARSAMSALNNANEEAPENPEISATSRNLRDIQAEVMSREDRGVKLGLGDFVFYSLMIAKASQTKDWSTIVAVFVAILIGMCSTLLLLAIRGHALPALPISIVFGVVFFFCTSEVVNPFTTELALQQAFI